jgi:tetratricopeptide (TPR) repeat protein
VGYARLGVLDKAIEYFQKAIELYPEKFYAKAEQNLIAANVDLHNYHNVMELANDYLKHSPQSKFVRIMKSDALEELNDKKQ